MTLLLNLRPIPMLNFMKTDLIMLTKYPLRWMILLGVSCLACAEVDLKSNPKRVADPVSSHWLVMDQSAGEQVGDVTTWDIHPNESGKYVVQILFDKGVSFAAKDGVPQKAHMIVAGAKSTEALKPNYAFGDMVAFEFKKSVSFNRSGKYKLSVSSDLPFSKVRLLPHHSNRIGSGKYHQQWRSMHESEAKQSGLRWFKEARFGMFIHWGIYSQASGVWKGTKIEQSPYAGPRVAEWLMSTFRIPRDEYAQLAKDFNPDASFAKNIAALAKKTGMKYVVVTAKHHDGFALFDSQSSDFDIADASPYEGDLIKELYDACLEVGVEFGVYYSHGNDWRDGSDGNVASVQKKHDKLGIYTHKQGKNTWDPSPNDYDHYLETKAYPQVRELLALLPKLRLIWFDGDGFITEEQAFDFYKMIYEINPQVVVNRRVGYQFGDYLDAGDNVIPGADVNLAKHWETCGTANNSWGYKAHDEDWKSTQELLYYFIDIVSKGGNYLLNIGPDGAGEVPASCVKHFHEVGAWVDKNSEAIFGTTRWSIPHEGGSESLLSGTGSRAHHGFSREFTQEDFWFSARDNKVYVMSLVKPKGEVRVLSLGQSVGKISSVRVLGDDSAVSWSQKAGALVLDLSEVSIGEHGYALEVLLDQGE